MIKIRTAQESADKPAMTAIDCPSGSRSFAAAEPERALLSQRPDQIQLARRGCVSARSRLMAYSRSDVPRGSGRNARVRAS